MRQPMTTSVASVAVSGDTAIVGAYGKLDNRGAHTLFVRDGIT
jgi:hypothetical protein